MTDHTQTASMNGLRVLVTGSRDWTDGTAVEFALWGAWKHFGSPPLSKVTVVHGGARGADSIAESIARKHGMQVECHPAAWDTRGRAAGVIRNSEMVNAGADVCLAFIKDGSRGATHCADAADKAGIPVRRHTPSSPGADSERAAGPERAASLGGDPSLGPGGEAPE